jgi:hypothetical protein
MTTASTFDVVDMYATAFEDRSSVFKEASFVQAIGMDVALDVVLFAHTGGRKVSITSKSQALCS